MSISPLFFQFECPALPIRWIGVIFPEICLSRNGRSLGSDNPCQIGMDKAKNLGPFDTDK
jgi:hypothetical protein